MEARFQKILDLAAGGEYDQAIAQCKLLGMTIRESSFAFLMNLAAANFHAARAGGDLDVFGGLARGYLQAAEHQLSKIETRK